MCLSLRKNWLPPPHHPHASGPPPLSEPKGSRSTLACGRGGGGSHNSDDWTESLALCDPHSSILFPRLSLPSYKLSGLLFNRPSCQPSKILANHIYDPSVTTFFHPKYLATMFFSCFFLLLIRVQDSTRSVKLCNSK